MRRALVIACAWLAVHAACHTARPAELPPRTPRAPTGANLDEDGVQMLFPSAPNATRFRLGDRDPHATPGFEIEDHTRASSERDGALRYHRVAAHHLHYSSGGEGTTVRLHVRASGNRQIATWKTQHGYLSSPADLGDQELTVYARPRGIRDPKRATFELKIRGGEHSSRDGDLASCTMMTLQHAGTGASTRFGKELVHPLYDYVVVEPQVDAHLTDGAWVGLKLASYRAPGDPTRVVNRLYVDLTPFDRDGRPQNHWQLLGEYIDVEGKSTGQFYSKLVDWGGWQTTFRADGIDSVDFALVSVRGITPPAAPPAAANPRG